MNICNGGSLGLIQDYEVYVTELDHSFHFLWADTIDFSYSHITLTQGEEQVDLLIQKNNVTLKTAVMVKELLLPVLPILL